MGSGDDGDPGSSERGMWRAHRPNPADLARAREAYVNTRALLLAAEDAHARAVVALREAVAAIDRAQAHRKSADAPPPNERHFLCGHAGMERTEDEGSQVLSLCPACRFALERGTGTFTQQRQFLVRDPA
jgi:hypothetical protein